MGLWERGKLPSGSVRTEPGRQTVLANGWLYVMASKESNSCA